MVFDDFSQFFHRYSIYMVILYDKKTEDGEFAALMTGDGRRRTDRTLLELTVIARM